MPDPAMNPILLVIYFAGTILASISTLWFKDRIDRRKSMEARIVALEGKVELRDKEIDNLQQRVNDLLLEVVVWKGKYETLEQDHHRLQVAHTALKEDFERLQGARATTTRDDLLEQAASLRKAGASVKQIAERMERHKSTIYRWLREAKAA